jgi:8-oxo-dGTP diphosphatase
MKHQTATVNVVAAVIRRGGRLLICKRPASKRHGELWEFPGGKQRPSEPPEAALARELAEELVLYVARIGRKLFSRKDPGSNFVIHFWEVEIAGEPKLREHSHVEWVRLKDLTCYDFAPADGAFAEYLKRPI